MTEIPPGPDELPVAVYSGNPFAGGSNGKKPPHTLCGALENRYRFVAPPTAATSRRPTACLPAVVPSLS